MPAPLDLLFFSCLIYVLSCSRCLSWPKCSRILLSSVPALLHRRCAGNHNQCSLCFPAFYLVTHNPPVLITVFVAILFLFTLGLNLRASRRRSRRRSTRSLPGSIPPTYSSIGLPRDSSYKADYPRSELSTRPPFFSFSLTATPQTLRSTRIIAPRRPSTARSFFKTNTSGMCPSPIGPSHPLAATVTRQPPPDNAGLQCRPLWTCRSRRCLRHTSTFHAAVFPKKSPLPLYNRRI